MTEIQGGRVSRAALHAPAGEAELRLTAAGNWQLAIRAEGEREWHLACSGDLSAGGISPAVVPRLEPIRHGAVLIDVAGRRVLVGERLVLTSKREFSLLAALASDPVRVFPKRQLMRSIWGYEGTRTRTLDSHASRVRVKLRNAGAPGYVVNCKGVGYRLCDCDPSAVGSASGG